jgi:hypothetical protein
VGLDRDCVGFLVEVDGGEPVGKSKDPAEHSSLVGGDLVEEDRVYGGVDGGAVFDDGTDEGFVGVVQGFLIAPTDAPSNPVQEVGSVAGFFEGFFDVLVEGEIFGKRDAEGYLKSARMCWSLGMAWLLSRRWGAWWRDLELLAPE